jgi:hypothetical protein
MSIEAMKQALDALEEHGTHYARHEDDYIKAITALRQAIEQAEMVKKGTRAWANTPDDWVDDLRGGEEIVPSDYLNSHQPEPFGWVNMPELTNHFEKVSCGTIYKMPGEGRTPLYVLIRQENRQVAKNATTGNQEVAKSATTDWEAVAADHEMTIAMLKLEQKREWVGLTDEERAECWSTSAVQSALNIEAKLKEKNNAA